MIAFALVNLCTSHSLSAHDDNPSTLSDSLASALHPQLRFMRVFGAQDETAPPIVLCSRPGLDSKVNVSYAYKFITIQFDVQSKIPLKCLWFLNTVMQIGRKIIILFE